MTTTPQGPGPGEPDVTSVLQEITDIYKFYFIYFNSRGKDIIFHKIKKCLECSVTYLQGYPLKNFFQNHPFQAFLVSRKYIFKHVKKNYAKNALF